MSVSPASSRTRQGRWRVTNPRVRQSYRLNVGTIVEETMLKVRLVRSRGGGPGRPARSARGGRMLGEIEEYFIEGLVIGDTFVFGGEVVRYEALVGRPGLCLARQRQGREGAVLYGRQVSALDLSRRAGAQTARRQARLERACRIRCATGCRCRRIFRACRRARELLVETFPRGNKHYLVCYPFEGRLAHQTLGMLLTRRLERARVRPLGFVANEYALAVWGLGDMSFMIRQGKLDLDALFDPDMLGDDLEAWLAESALMKRTFRTCAVISGLIARRFTGEEKTRRQVLFSTDLIYDVLRKHQADHVLLRAARADAATGLLDLERLERYAGANPGANHPQGTRPGFAAGGAGDAGNRPRSRFMAKHPTSCWRKPPTNSSKRRQDNVTADCDRRSRTARSRVSQKRCRRRRRRFVADLSGALFWEEQSLLVVSDLHLEKGSSFAARGVLLPPYDTVATLGRLAAVIARHDPRMVIALGDSFHDRTRP